MKLRMMPFTRLALLLSVLLALTVSTAQAQANLLANPGFEPPFNAAGGNQLLLVAQGWTPWNVPQGPGDTESENVQPEYYPATNTEDAPGIPRIHSGSDAQQFWTLYATFQGGVFQRVTGVQPGSQLTFNLFAYVWSSSFEDPNLSEEDGGVLVQVGIDPTGGEDGQSPNIIWSAASSLYDGYNAYTVTTNASGAAVSVWVRAIVSFAVKQSVVYVDDASLTAAGGAAPTNTPAPPPTSIPPTNTVAPANTPIPPTNTVAAPPTNAPVVTATPAPPTNTAAPAVPTNTPAPAATATTQGPTNTPAPTRTPGSVDPNTFPNSIVHNVRAGDTVGRLATLYGSTTQAIITANGLDDNALIFVGQSLVIPVRIPAPATITPTPTTAVVVVTATPGAPPPPPPNPGGTTAYLVQPGDTLRQIALRYNTTVAALAQLNGITNVNLIFVGQTLLVPAPGQAVTPVPQPPPTQPTTYRVQPGDNLYRISLRLGVSMQALIQANNITNPNFVFVGQVLRIP